MVHLTTLQTFTPHLLKNEWRPMRNLVYQTTAIVPLVRWVSTSLGILFPLRPS